MVRSAIGSPPPLANLFAAAVDDPRHRDDLEILLATCGKFSAVWRPEQEWVVAVAPVPGTIMDTDAVRSAGLAFVEGRDRLEDDRSQLTPDRLASIVHLAGERPEQLDRLPGDFGFLTFGPGRSATIVRSCSGLVPFHVCQQPGWTAISTRVSYLARFLPHKPDIDPLVWGVWGSGFGLFPDNRSFLIGTSIVPRGHAVRVRDGRICATIRYFDPRPAESRRPSSIVAAEHVEHLRSLLLERLDRDLDTEGGNLLTLSGGVDSSSLGALAAGTLAKPLCSLSFVPPPGDPTRARELSYIESLTERFRFGRRWLIPVDDARLAELARQAPAVGIPVIHPALCALPGLLNEADVRVLVGGEFADEVCGSVLTVPDWAAATSLRRLLTDLAGLPTGRKDILRWAAWPLLWRLGRPRMPWPARLPGFVAPAVQQEYSEWRRAVGRAAAAEPAPWRYLTLRCLHDGWVLMNWEATTALGVRRSFPFHTRESLELVYQCHPCELVGPGTKRLLRAAMKNEVPSRNLGRPDKGIWSVERDSLSVPWQLPIPARLHSVLDDSWRCPASTVPAYPARLLTTLVVAVTALARDQEGC